MTATATARKIIAFEEKVALPQKVFMPRGSIAMVDERVPVSVRNNMYKPIGFARDLQRNDKNEVSVEIVLEDEHVVKLIAHGVEFWELYSPSMFLNEIQADGTIDSTHQRTMSYGRLREIVLVPIAAEGTWGEPDA